MFDDIYSGGEKKAIVGTLKIIGGFLVGKTGMMVSGAVKTVKGFKEIVEDNKDIDRDVDFFRDSGFNHGAWD